MPRRTVNTRVKLPRSQGGVDPRVRATLDRFVEGSLMGLNTTQAALFAGVSSASAARTGQAYKRDPYVLERFRKLREKLTKDQICSFAEQALDVKSIAFDDSLVSVRAGSKTRRMVLREATPKQVRLQAHALLARLMGHEAVTKSESTINGGVLLLPVADSMEEWEKQAIAAQAALKREVDADANG